MSCRRALSKGIPSSSTRCFKVLLFFYSDSDTLCANVRQSEEVSIDPDLEAAWRDLGFFLKVGTHALGVP